MALRHDRAFFGRWPRRPAEISFRPAVDADRGFLAALYASTREEELAPVPWPDSAKRDFLEHQFQLQHAYYHDVFVDSDFLVILHRDEPIGRVYVHRTATEILVIDIALLLAWRGRGIGSALLGEIVDEAQRTGRHISLHVEPHNRAKRLYERLGFQMIENRGVYDYMTWTLPPGRAVS